MDVCLISSHAYWLNWVAPLVFGACIGSFLNVCVYRLPLGESIVTPPSRCAACGKRLFWWENIPVLSWLWQRGRCRCGLVPVGFRYPLVEIITALSFLWLWNAFPPLLVLAYGIFVCGLIVATFVDFDLYIIPDEISLGGCVVGLILSALIPAMHGTESHLWGFLHGLFGMLLGGGLLFAIAVGGTILLRKEAMGMGDVKLLAAMGAFLGWQAPLFIIAASSMIGSVCGIALMLWHRRRWGLRIAFGPYLVLAAIIWLMGGKKWMADYLALFSEF